MKDRIFTLRKSILGLSRDDFGAAIGMSGSEIRNIENGVTVLKENKIPLLCSTYNVREEWLRSGSGEMFRPMSKVDEIQEIANNAMERSAEDARKSLAAHLAKLTDAEAILLAELLERQLKG